MNKVVNRGPYAYEIDGLRLEVDGSPVPLTQEQIARLRADGAQLEVAGDAPAATKEA